MSFISGIKDFFMPSDEEEDYREDEHDEEETDTEPEESPVESATTTTARRPVETRNNDIDVPTDSPRKKNGNVINVQTTTQLQVVLVKPEKFSDAREIADHLIARKTVVLNLETATAENKRRIIDFLVGVAYANGGNLKPVANLTYIITPYNVGFVGDDIVDELENNGVIV